MRRIIFGIIGALCAQTPVSAPAQHLLRSPDLEAVISLETGGIAQLHDLSRSGATMIFGFGEPVLEIAAGAFRPAPFSAASGDESSLSIVSPELRHQGATLPLRTTIEYRLKGNRLAVSYRFEALDRTALDDGLDVIISSSAWDSLHIRNHYSGESPLPLGSAWITRYFALNQLYELGNPLRRLSIVFPNPYHSLVTAKVQGAGPFTFDWHILVGTPPIQAVEPKGPKLASVLAPGVKLFRQIELVVDPEGVPSTRAAEPAAYLSPFPSGYDQAIAITFDDIPFGRHVWPISGHDPSAPLEQYLVRLLEDHPRMKMGWVVLPDALFSTTDLVNPDFSPGKWWLAHGTHRMLAVAPASYLDWVRTLNRDSVVYGYEHRVHLGSHGYHHTPEMKFGANFEFQSYDQTVNDSTFAAIAREFSLLGLGANSLKWIRFPGFYFTRATVEALIENRFAFFDYWGIYDKLPWMLFYSESGRIWGAGTWWEGDTPSSYEKMAEILGAGKLCHTAGHPHKWFDGEPEAAYEQMSGIFTEAERYFPNLGYLFPDEAGFFAMETYDIHDIETEIAYDAVIVSFSGAALSAQTIMMEWPSDWAIPAEGTVDELLAASAERRGGRLVVVLPALSGGDHRLRLAKPSECPSPTVAALRQNYPNPFKAGTVIPYDVPRGAHVNLAVYNLRGEKIAVIEDGDRLPGTYSAQWNGRDGAGKDVASGIYFCRLTIGGETRTAKMTLIR